MAVRMASATAVAACSGVLGRNTALASGSKMPAWSRHSCRMPRRMPGRATFVDTSLASSTSGVPDAAASPNAPAAFAAPGPVVVSATPRPPVARASPSAA